MANVVLVVDMVVGFLERGHNLYFEGYRGLIPNIQRLIEEEQAAGSRVIFLCDTHDPDDLEFQMFPVHCVKGTEEPNVIREL
jgi:nicotinamidase/pyrazinamidase